jgi:transposase InsO family protein
MDKGRFLIETHLRTHKPLAELAAAHGVSRSWLYKLLARYNTYGEAGLEPRSRRPHTSPTRITDAWDERVVVLRKELSDLGVDAGAVSIQTHLERRHGTAPSPSTIWRILKQRGFVTPQPQKRPKSSWNHFVAEFPNECWQADVTHWALADGTAVEILNIIDDHSRVGIDSRVFVTTKSSDVVRALHRGAEKWGYPQRFLTDNGAIFTSGPRGGASVFETELFSLGIAARHSRPYHPQTCGKVERFHQTLKKWLAKHPVATKKQLQVELDAFVAYYNDTRPHRGIGRQTPATAHAAREKTGPRGALIDVAGYRVRHDKISKAGSVTLRHKGRLHHIGIGAAYKGWHIVMLIAGLEIRIFDLAGNQLGHTKLDPTKDYQPTA